MKLLIVLAFAAATLWAYNLGQLNTLLQDERTVISQDYKETGCNDITRGTDGNLVCQINMQHEDDNLKIYKGAYGNG